jgi:hypothetical protein
MTSLDYVRLSEQLMAVQLQHQATQRMIDLMQSDLQRIAENDAATPQVPLPLQDEPGDDQ